MPKFTQWFDSFLDAIQSLLMSVLVKVGPFFVALMPALFMAYAIYHTFQDEAGPELAFVFAVVVGIAWETVGIIATHTATDLYNAVQKGATQPVKFWLMVALVPVYVFGVAGVVYFSQDAFTPLVKGLGIVSPFLTAIVYIAVALARDLNRTELAQSENSQHQAERERAEQAHKRAMELQQAEVEKQLRLKELELEAKVRIAQVKADAQRPQELIIPPALLAGTVTEPASDSYECDGCQRPFGTKQALAAHKRFCGQSGVIHRNGDGWRVNQ